MRRGRWLPALAWAAMILVATSVPGSNLPRAFPHADKLVHLLLYAPLGWLLGRALRAGRVVPVALRASILALAGVAAFAAADEWHQELVPGRSADPVDWLVDLAGATAALAYVTHPPRTEQRT